MADLSVFRNWGRLGDSEKSRRRLFLIVLLGAAAIITLAIKNLDPLGLDKAPAVTPVTSAFTQIAHGMTEQQVHWAVGEPTEVNVAPFNRARDGGEWPSGAAKRLIYRRQNELSWEVTLDSQGRVISVASFMEFDPIEF